MNKTKIEDNPQRLVSSQGQFLFPNWISMDHRVSEATVGRLEALQSVSFLTPSFLSRSKAPCRKSRDTSSFSSSHWMTKGSNHLEWRAWVVFCHLLFP